MQFAQFLHVGIACVWGGEGGVVLYSSLHMDQLLIKHNSSMVQPSNPLHIGVGLGPVLAISLMHALIGMDSLKKEGGGLYCGN